MPLREEWEGLFLLHQNKSGDYRMKSLINRTDIVRAEKNNPGCFPAQPPGPAACWYTQSRLPGFRGLRANSSSGVSESACERPVGTA